MNAKLLLILAAVTVLSSCSTAYRTGQTPDDVYFSPAKSRPVVVVQDEYSDTKKTSNEDREIRMGINDYRWRSFGNDYSYNPYLYGYSYGYYYNPYYCAYPVYNYYINTPVIPSNSTPRMTNLAGYNSGYNNQNSAVSKIKYTTTNPNRNYNNSNTANRTYPTPDNNTNSNNSSNSDTRSYTPSSSSSNSGAISRPSGGRRF